MPRKSPVPLSLCSSKWQSRSATIARSPLLRTSLSSRSPSSPPPAQAFAAVLTLATSVWHPSGDCEPSPPAQRHWLSVIVAGRMAFLALNLDSHLSTPQSSILLSQSQSLISKLSNSLALTLSVRLEYRAASVVGLGTQWAEPKPQPGNWALGRMERHDYVDAMVSCERRSHSNSSSGNCRVRPGGSGLGTRCMGYPSVQHSSDQVRVGHSSARAWFGGIGRLGHSGAAAHGGGHSGVGLGLGAGGDGLGLGHGHGSCFG
ncbi:hypothetical protein Cgig2_010763 [Carnegiea gigantea]|uniref:Uncharacterized protein n=1 Tax=Carnegiea gigantea TaxID=171969 RepID=A0A9Q1Q4K6_9CARY|nr:hypothetical protein Cgig2_010763 [Carnegiea gigantea]